MFKNIQAYYPKWTTAYAGWRFAQTGGGIPGPVGSGGVSVSGVGSSILSQYATSIAGGGSPAVTNCTGNGSNQVCIDTETTITLTNAILGLHAQAWARRAVDRIRMPRDLSVPDRDAGHSLRSSAASDGGTGTRHDDPAGDRVDGAGRG